MYGYNGMGLHRCHPSWWSLVVRSRSAGLTARLLRVLELDRNCRPQDFIDNVPGECARTYKECMDTIKSSLAARAEALLSDGPSSARTTTTASTACPPSVPAEEDAASTDGSEESEGGELEGGEPEEAPEWADGED